jgi:hypothetical protein
VTSDAFHGRRYFGRLFATQEIRRAHQTVHGTEFVVRHISEDKLFGTRAIWRGQVKIQVSDVHRTVIDLLNSPADGGGIRHVADCLRAYFARPDCDTSTPPPLCGPTGKWCTGEINYPCLFGHVDRVGYRG